MYECWLGNIMTLLSHWGRDSGMISWALKLSITPFEAFWLVCSDVWWCKCSFLSVRAALVRLWGEGLSESHGFYGGSLFTMNSNKSEHILSTNDESDSWKSQWLKMMCLIIHINICLYQLTNFNLTISQNLIWKTAATSLTVELSCKL